MENTRIVNGTSNITVYIEPIGNNVFKVSGFNHNGDSVREKTNIKSLREAQILAKSWAN